MSGVSAGMDGMMAFLREQYPEAQHPGLIDKIANEMEYRYEADPAKDPFADVFGAKDVPAQSWW